MHDHMKRFDKGTQQSISPQQAAAKPNFDPHHMSHVHRQAPEHAVRVANPANISPITPGPMEDTKTATGNKVEPTTGGKSTTFGPKGGY